MSGSSFLKTWFTPICSFSNDFLCEYAKANPEFGCYILVFLQLSSMLSLGAAYGSYKFHTGTPSGSLRECGTPSNFLDEDGRHYNGLYPGPGNGTDCEESYLTVTDENNHTYVATRTHTIVDSVDPDIANGLKPCRDQSQFRNFYHELDKKGVEIWGNAAFFYQEEYYSQKRDETVRFQVHLHDVGGAVRKPFETQLIPSMRSCFEEELSHQPGAPWQYGIPRLPPTQPTNDSCTDNNAGATTLLNPLVYALGAALIIMFIITCSTVYYYKFRSGISHKKNDDQYKEVGNGDIEDGYEGISRHLEQGDEAAACCKC